MMTINGTRILGIGDVRPVAPAFSLQGTSVSARNRVTTSAVSPTAGLLGIDPSPDSMV